MTLPSMYTATKGDYEIVDDVETVTLTPNDGVPADDTAAALATVKAQRMPLKLPKQSIDLVGPVGDTSQQMIFILFSDTLGALEPSEGYKITDADSVSWIIDSATTTGFGTDWKCVCRQAKA